jgi:hypothetical protein
MTYEYWIALIAAIALAGVIVLLISTLSRINQIEDDDQP